MVQAAAASLFVVNLPTWFDDEQENGSASDDEHAKRYQKCLHNRPSW
jgi:hypothetical protein